MLKKKKSRNTVHWHEIKHIKGNKNNNNNKNTLISVRQVHIFSENALLPPKEKEENN